MGRADLRAYAETYNINQGILFIKCNSTLKKFIVKFLVETEKKKKFQLATKAEFKNL